MALVVEDGTGLSTAESYISVADAETRLGNLGDTTFAALSTAEKEEALRKATIYMEGAYRLRWKGTRLLRAQALSWPRYGAVVDSYDLDSDTVPTEVANACADFALKASTGELLPDQERAVIREKVGSLETEYGEFSSQTKTYPLIARTLAPFLKSSSSVTKVGRS